MIESILYGILALIGLGFLIFIHELGHYFMARKVGMKVEAFSIGFGKPLVVWERKGVKWQLCMLPFGGYVRIAGMEKKGAIEPYQIPEGFFGKKPKDRIKVALMGPLVNLAFALVLFTFIWASGGRNKQFSEFTSYIGWVDPSSKPYVEGIRPGNEIAMVDQRPLEGFTDLSYAALLESQPLTIEGFKIDYFSGEKKPFLVQLDDGEKSRSIEQKLSDVRALAPANFLIYKELADGRPVLESGSPMENSGIQYGDRIVWIDGQPVFSLAQLSAIINQPRVLLTVQRGNEIFLSRIPRLRLADLQMNEAQKAELDDWRTETGLTPKLPDTFFIPYILNQQNQVESVISYVDEFSQHCPAYQAGQPGSCNPEVEKALLPGDKILAVDGQPVSNAFDSLRALQTRQSQIVVLRPGDHKTISWKEANAAFINDVDWSALQTITQSIGTQQPVSSLGKLHLLHPVTPVSFFDFPQTLGKSKWVRSQEATRAQIDKIKDDDKRALALKNFEQQQKKLRLGVVLQDQSVRYNPQPFILFGDVLEQIGHTLKALFSGTLTPKAMSGPVGIVQVMHYSWGQGFMEALFWLGVISLNLGIFNLLPIPVLDGGYICFALWESITKKPIKAKTMERLVIPFVVILIALLLFTTYNDLSRLLKGLFF